MKKLLLKYLGLTNFDVYLENTEKRFLDLEKGMDYFENNLYDLSNVNDEIADLENRIDDLDSRVGDVEEKEILDYESYDFISCGDYDTEKEEMQLKIDRLTKALKKLAFESNLELRIDKILEGYEDD